MQPRYWAGLAALALLATVGNATAETREWSGVTSGYTIDQNLRHILITAPGAYKFESVTNGALDDIVKIDTDLTQGQYNEPIEAVVYIARDPNLGTGPGCRDLGQVTIGNGLPVSFGDWLLSRDIAALASVHVRNIYGTCDVSGGARAALRVYGNVLGPVTVDGDVDRLYLADFVAAPIYCGGDVGSLSVAGYLGSSIYVAGAVGAFDVDGYLSSTGALEVDGDVGIIGVNETPGYWGSSIRVGESVELVALLGTMGSTATLDIGGDPGDVEVADFNAIGGTVNVAQDVSGNIVFEYLSRFYGAIHIGGDVLGDWILPRRELTGDITIDGTLSSRIHAQRDLDQALPAGGTWTIGTIDGPDAGITFGEIADPNFVSVGISLTVGTFREGSIEIYGQLADPGPVGTGGHIRVLDQFGVDPNEVAQIVVTRPFPGESEYVTIDFNAEHVDSVWAEGSSVTIAGTPYEENSPAAGVFESTPCKGDLLNDDLCDFYDIDALIEAFGDGETYNANDPGLAGSRTWHGDLNCDSVVDFYDIDGFVARLGDCTSECYEGDNLQGGGEGPQMQMMGGGAAAIAAQLAASVSAENMPALIVAVEQLALNPPANSTTDWSAVLAALAGV